MLINLETWQNQLQLNRKKSGLRTHVFFPVFFGIEGRVFNPVFYINNFIITKHTAPGSPSNPTKILVKILSPMWNPHIPPTRFIKNIVSPPKMELIISFKIFFIGTINILPKINKKHMHAKYVIIFVSIFIPLYTLFINLYEFIWTNIH